MSVVKSVWQNWEMGLDFRTRRERAHGILGNNQSPLQSFHHHMNFMFSPPPPQICIFGWSLVKMCLSVLSPAVSASQVFGQLLPRRVAVDGLSWKEEKKGVKDIGKR